MWSPFGRWTENKKINHIGIRQVYSNRSVDIDLLQPVLETESHFTLEDIPDPIQSVSVKNQSGQNPQNVLRLLDIVQLQPLYLHVADLLSQLRLCCVLSVVFCHSGVYFSWEEEESPTLHFMTCDSNTRHMKLVLCTNTQNICL